MEFRGVLAFFETKTFQKLLLVHGVFFLARCCYLVWGPFDLFSEEAQYWVWSKNLALSYYSKPPFVAYFNFLTTSIFGSSAAVIKLNGLCFGFLSVLVTYQLSLEIFHSKQQAVIASFCSYLLPFHHTTFNFFMTDAPLYFFWGLGLLALWRMIHGAKHAWIVMGVSCGLGFLSKYTMLFMAPSVLVLFLVTDKNWLARKELYGALFLAALFTIPVIWWNVEYDFVSARHVSSIGAKTLTLERRLSFVGEYIGGQIGIVSPLLLPFLFFFKRQNLTKKIRWFLWVGPVFTFGFFLLYSLTKRVEVNWPVFAYFPIPIILANTYAGLNNARLFKTLSMITLGLIAGLFYFSPYLYGLGLGRIIHPSKDPAARMMGWRSLGATVQYHADETNGRYFLFSDNYHVASEASFYSRDQKVPIVLNLGRRRNQYDLWPGMHQYEGSDYKGVFVTRERQIPSEVLQGFEKLIRVDTVKTQLGGEFIKPSIVATFGGLIHVREQESKSY